ncbi:MAG: halocyanin domain-containing protein [Halorientalis sp.]
MSSSGPTRRTLLRGVAGGAAAAAVGAGGTGVAAAQQQFGGWLSDVSNYDGTVADRTGQDEVTVRVGAQGNGGAFAFAPPAVRVDPGATVVWEWTGDGGQHNVVAQEGADFESQLTAEAGFTFEQTFESEGVVKYFCRPHRTLGMKGVVVVGGDGGGGGTATPVPAEYGDWFSNVGNYDGTTVDRRGQDSVTVTVGAQGNGGAFAFAPPAVRISPGTEVVWEWTGDGGQHNVVAEEGADFESQLTAEAGFTFSRTFEEPGVITYFCRPHRTLGMKGALVVDPTEPGGAGGGEHEDDRGQFTFTPELTGLVGAIALGVLSPIAFALFLRARRGRVGPPEPEREGGAAGRLERVAEPAAGATTLETADAEPARHLGHDEFEPVGTAGLVVAYFLILVLMWVFMYFVEFLGNGPTIIG